MNLIIKKPYTCNAVSFPSNKGTKESIKLDSRAITHAYEELGIVVFKPIIDRLAFTIPLAALGIPKPEISGLEKVIRQDLFHLAKKEEGGLSLPEKIYYNKQPYRSYELNLRYTPKDATKSMLIQVSPKNPKLDFMRIDMNPAHYSPKQLKAFKTFLSELFEIPGKIVTYADILTASRIHRADVAVDILGARPSDLIITTVVNKQPSPKKSYAYMSTTGRVETVYPNAKADKTNQSYIYDKRLEQLEKGLQPMYGNVLHSRFECRIHKTNFAALPKTTNRCGRIMIRALKLDVFEKLHYTHQLFIRHAIARNLDTALRIIPKKRQESYKESYDLATVNIWNPEKLWGFWKTWTTKGYIFAE